MPNEFVVLKGGQLAVFDLATRAFLPGSRAFGGKLVIAGDYAVTHSNGKLAKWASLADANPLVSRDFAGSPYLLWSGSELVLLSPGSDKYTLRRFDLDLNPLGDEVSTDVLDGGQFYAADLGHALATAGGIAVRVYGQVTSELLWIIAYDGTVKTVPLEELGFPIADRISFADHGDFVFVAAGESASFRVSPAGEILGTSALHLSGWEGGEGLTAGVIGPHVFAAWHGRGGEGTWGTDAAFLTFDEARSQPFEPAIAYVLNHQRVASNGRVFATHYQTEEHFESEPVPPWPNPGQPMFALYECESGLSAP